MKIKKEIIVMLFFIFVYSSVAICGMIILNPLLIVEGLGAVTLSLLPVIIKRFFRIHISWFIQLSCHIFLVLCLVFGEQFDFYMTVSWWDDLLHVFSGFGITLIAYCLIDFLIRKSDIKCKSVFCILGAVALSFSVGLIWELYEFSVDSVMGTNMQRYQTNGNIRNALMDTMTDLTECFVGTITATTSLVFLRKTALLSNAFSKVSINKSYQAKKN